MDAQGFIWHELMSRDPDASEGFYETVTGVEVQRVAEALGDYRLLLVDGRPVAGMTGPRAESTTWPSGGPEGHWVPYFGTDDVEAAVARAKSCGGTVLVEPVDIPGWGRGSGASRSGRGHLRGLPTRVTEATDSHTGTTGRRLGSAVRSSRRLKLKWLAPPPAHAASA